MDRPTLEKLLLAAKLCEWSYDHEEPMPGGCSLHYSIDAAHDHAYVVDTPMGRGIVFRGSDDPLDWVSNLDLDTVKISFLGKDFRLHHGFNRSYKDLWVADERIRSGRDEIFAVGHSRGAALATIYTIWKGIPLITFGSPRVGKHIEPDLIRDHLRVVNHATGGQRDVITSMPAFGGYEHCPGMAVCLHPEGIIMREDDGWHSGDMEPHRIGSYIANIEAAIIRQK